MKKIYLINYVDINDNTKGTICASENEPLNMSQETKDAIKQWLQCGENVEKQDILDVIGDLRKAQSAFLNEYEFFIEEIFLY